MLASGSGDDVVLVVGRRPLHQHEGGAVKLSVEGVRLALGNEEAVARILGNGLAVTDIKLPTAVQHTLQRVT